MTDTPPAPTELDTATTDTAPSDATIPPASPPSRRRPSRRTMAVAVLILGIIVAAIAFAGREATTSHYLSLSMLLFVIGAFGVLVRRNALVLFMCIELMLNAVNIAFVAFARQFADIGGVDGHVAVLFVIIVAAAEVAVGLAIIVSIFRRRASINVDDVSALKW